MVLCGEDIQHITDSGNKRSFLSRLLLWLGPAVLRLESNTLRIKEDCRTGKLAKDSELRPNRPPANSSK